MHIHHRLSLDSRLITIMTMLLLVAATTPAAGAAEQEARNTVRPEIGKSILAAQGALKNNRVKDALAKAREASLVKDKTLYESYVVSRVLAQAAAAAGDVAGSARAYEDAANSGMAAEGERPQLLAAAASQHYLAKNYGKSVEMSVQALKGGHDPALRRLYIQSLYMGNQYSRAAKELLSDIRADEQAGKSPSEEHLQLLANSYLSIKDNAGYANAMEKLVKYYPKPDYWLAVIHATTIRPDFPERLAIDVGRLKLATGTLRTTTEYVELAQLALQDGYAAEAQAIIDKGFTAGVLGIGPEAERHKRLKDIATREVAEERIALAQKPEASTDGAAMIKSGFSQALNGHYDTGINLMEQGIRKGGLKRMEDAMLHLGYAYHLSGQPAKALAKLKSIGADIGDAAIARLWVIHLEQESR